MNLNMTEIQKNKILRFIILVLIVLMFLLFFRNCKEQRELEKNLEATLSENTIFKNKIGTLTNESKVIELSNKQLKELIIKKNDTLKKLTDGFSKVKVITKFKTNTIIDTIKIVYKYSIPCNFEINGKKSTELYSFKYKSTNKSFEIDSLNVPTELFVITGTKKKWFWGKNTLVTDVSTSNKYVHISENKSFVTSEKKRFYETTTFKLLTGFVLGVAVSK